MQKTEFEYLFFSTVNINNNIRFCWKNSWNYLLNLIFVKLWPKILNILKWTELLFNVRWFYCLYLSGFWIGTERNFSKWNHDGCKTSQNCGWKMQKWHKTAEICQTSKKRTHFQISEACFFDSSSFSLAVQFYFDRWTFLWPYFFPKQSKDQ